MVDNLSTQLSDGELLARLTNTEDNFVERKRFSDDREWLRTVVAFANSCPVDYPGILFIGAYDNGQLEQPKSPVNLDSLQKTLSEKINEAWPPIYYLPRILRKNGQEFLAVVVPGSHLRPHFAGHSFIRIGSQTKKASEEQFANLISQRSSKAREILNWKGKEITLQFPPTEFTLHGTSQRRRGDSLSALVEECNQFYLTLQFKRHATDQTQFSYPLEYVEISFDSSGNRLEIILTRHIY